MPRSPRFAGYDHKRHAARILSLGAASLLAAALASPAAATIKAPATVAGRPGQTRDPAMWPFAANSPWNTPIGSGVRSSAISGCTQNVRNTSNGSDLNMTQWSVPVYQASHASPPATFFDANTGQSFAGNLNPGATPSGPPGGDNDLAIVNTSLQVTDEFWQAQVSNSRVSGSDYARYSLYGSGIGRPLRGDQQGVRAYGGSLIAGLIRYNELQHGINHALAFSQPRNMNRPGWVWPAISQDSGGGYTGNVPMGQLVYIPQRYFRGLGLSPYGIKIAKALHFWGAYLVDSSGDFDVYAEPAVASQIGQAGHDTIAYSDLPILRKLLVCVTNNSPHSVGGGGTHFRWLNPPPFSPPPPGTAATGRKTGG